MLCPLGVASQLHGQAFLTPCGTVLDTQTTGEMREEIEPHAYTCRGWQVDRVPDYRVQRTWHHRARTCLLRHVVAQWPFGAQCADLLQDERSHSGTEPPLFATQGRQWRALRKEPALSTPDA